MSIARVLLGSPGSLGFAWVNSEAGNDRRINSRSLGLTQCARVSPGYFGLAWIYSGAHMSSCGFTCARAGVAGISFVYVGSVICFIVDSLWRGKE